MRIKRVILGKEKLSYTIKSFAASCLDGGEFVMLYVGSFSSPRTCIW